MVSHRILQGHVLEQLATLPDESVDCVIADPPYGETSLEWDAPVTGWADALLRVLKPSGSMWVFGSLRFFMEQHEEFHAWRLAQEVVWEKHNGSNAFNDRFRRVHELAAQFYPENRPWSGVYKKPLFSSDATARTIRRKKKPQHWNDIGGLYYESHDGGPRQLRSVLYCRSEHGRALHPTQKPVPILTALLEYSCPDGGLALDPFSGSGSTLIAAKCTGRSAIGIELNPAYVEMSVRRIEEDCPLFNRAADADPAPSTPNPQGDSLLCPQ